MRAEATRESQKVNGHWEKFLGHLTFILTSIEGLKLWNDIRPTIAPGWGSPSIMTTLNVCKYKIGIKQIAIGQSSEANEQISQSSYTSSKFIFHGSLFFHNSTQRILLHKFIYQGSIPIISIARIFNSHETKTYWSFFPSHLKV